MTEPDNIGTPTVSFSDIEGGYPGVGNMDPPQDPLFVGTSNVLGADGFYYTIDDGLRLGSESPCEPSATNEIGMGAYQSSLPRAYDPSPAHGSKDQPTVVVFQWQAGVGAARHILYLGTNPNSLQKRYEGTDTYYAHNQALEPYTRYYWRVDEEYLGNTIPGRLWSFMTGEDVYQSIRPLAWDQTIERTYEESPIYFYVDAAPAGGGYDRSNLTYFINIGAQLGVVSIDMNNLTEGARFKYEPAEEIGINDSFSYKVHDGNTFSEVATVNLRFSRNVEEPPIVVKAQDVWVRVPIQYNPPPYRYLISTEFQLRGHKFEPECEPVTGYEIDYGSWIENIKCWCWDMGDEYDVSKIKERIPPIGELYYLLIENGLPNMKTAGWTLSGYDILAKFEGSFRYKVYWQENPPYSQKYYSNWATVHISSCSEYIGYCGDGFPVGCPFLDCELWEDTYLIHPEDGGDLPFVLLKDCPCASGCGTSLDPFKGSEIGWVDTDYLSGILSPPVESEDTGWIYKNVPADFYGDESFWFRYLSCYPDDPTCAGVGFVPIYVFPVNDPPEATSFTGDNRIITSEDTPIPISLVISDPDFHIHGENTILESDLVTCVISTWPSHGTLTYIGPGPGDWRYEPAPNYYETDSFTYSAWDGTAGNLATVEIEVTSVNDTPEAVDDVVDSYEPGPTIDNIDVLANDFHPDDIGFSIVDEPLTCTNGGTVVVDNGKIDYTHPDPLFYGIDTFIYRVQDTREVFDSATVTIRVQSAPVANDDDYDTAKNVVLIIANVLGNDSDPDGDDLDLVSWTKPSHGRLIYFGNGGFGYLPDTDYVGEDSFTYTLLDLYGNVASATVTITVLDSLQGTGEDSDGDGLTDAEEATYGTDPYDPDSDDDGLLDGDEVNTYLTDPMIDDSDYDGIEDGVEVAFGLDPTDTTDATKDYDDDGLTNIEETENGTNPFDDDTDDDGLTDGEEVNTYNTDPTDSDSDDDGLTDAEEVITYGTDPLDNDTDDDGLDDGDEVNTYYTDPFERDTDGDGLPDGWEADYGFDPTVPDQDFNFDDDPDNDGLDNLGEVIYGTDPYYWDTDGDGVSDGDEVAQGSDPLDPRDNGEAPPQDELVIIRLTVGDYSGSHSERYNLIVGPPEGQSSPLVVHQAREYGEVESRVYKLFKPGYTYPIRIVHTGSIYDIPDYDHEVQIDDEQLPSGVEMVLEDPHNILCLYPEDWPGTPAQSWGNGKSEGYGCTSFYPEGKVAYMHLVPQGMDVINGHLVNVDLDIDSDNDQGYDPPARIEYEDWIEDSEVRPGKYIYANNYLNDDDNDSVPDFADGFDLNESLGDADDVNPLENFVPLVVQLHEQIDLTNAKIKFDYVASAPMNVQSNYAIDPLPAAGALRIWTRTGNEGETPTPRNRADVANGGDYVGSNVEYEPVQLGFTPENTTLIFYIEAIELTEDLADSRIEVLVDPDADGPKGFTVFDAVRVTVIPESNFDVFEAITGVTPGSGRSLPVPGMDVYAEVLLHNRQLKITHTNFVIPGRKLSFGVSQTYRSGKPGSQYLAPGWYASWDQHFRKEGTDYIFRGPDGREDTFSESTDPQWLLIPPGYTCQVQVVDGQQPELIMIHTDGSKTVYKNWSGNVYRIISFEDRFGNGIDYYYYDYDGFGTWVLDYVQDDMGRSYLFEYQTINGSPHLQYITEFNGETEGLKYIYSYQDVSLYDRFRITCESKGGPLRSLVDYAYSYNLPDHNYILGVNINGQAYDYLNVVYDSAESPQVDTLLWGDSIRDPMDSRHYVVEEFIPHEFLAHIVLHIDTDYVGREYIFDTAPDTTMLCNLIFVDPITWNPYGLDLPTSYGYHYGQKGRTEHRITKVTYPKGDYTAYEYLSEDRLQNDPILDGNNDIFDKRGFANVTKVSRNMGSNISGNGGVGLNSTAPLVQTYAYNGENFNFQLDHSIDPAGVKTQYVYGAPQNSLTQILIPTQGYVDPTLDPSPDTIRFMYNPQGQLIKKQNPNGGILFYEYYDHDTNNPQYLHWITNTIQGDTYVFDAVARNEIPGNDRQDYEISNVDIYGRVWQAVNPAGGITDNTYDFAGRLVNKQLPPLKPGVPGNSREMITYGYLALWDRIETVTHQNPVATHSAGAEYGTVASTITYSYDDLARPVYSNTWLQGNLQETYWYYEPWLERLTCLKRDDNAFNHILYDRVGRPKLMVYNHNSVNLVGMNLPGPAPNPYLTKPAVGVANFYNANSELTYQVNIYGDDFGVDISEPAGVLETAYKRDWAGRAAQVKQVVSGRRTERAWNAAGQLTDVMAYSHDQAGNPDVLVAHATSDYHPNGSLDTTTDVLTEYAVSSTADNQGGTYAVEDNFTAYQDTLDDAGRPVNSTYAGINIDRDFTINNDSWRAYPTGHAANAPALTYGPRHNIQEIWQPDLGLDAVTDIFSSGSGAPGLIHDAGGNIHDNTIDESGNIWDAGEDIAGPDQRITSLDNDPANKISSIARKEQVTETSYDDAGRPVFTDYYYGTYGGDPDVSESIEYDDLGRVAKVVRKDGSSLIYDYYNRTNSNPNNRDQLRQVIFSTDSQPDVLLRLFENYNCFGYPKRLVEYNPYHNGDYVVTERDYKKTWGPGFGRLIEEYTTIYEQGGSDYGTYKVGYVYDIAGRQFQMTYPGDATDPYLEYDYENNSHRLWKITKKQTGQADVIVYECGRDAAFKLPGTKNFYKVEPAGSITAAVSNEYDIASQSYGSRHLGLVGNMKVETSGGDDEYFSNFAYNTRGLKADTSQWQSGVSRRYNYDGLSRLREAVPDTGDKFGWELFPLDSFENRMYSAFVDGREITYEPSPGRYRNQYLTFDDPDGIAAQGGSATFPEHTLLNYTKVNFQPEETTDPAGYDIYDTGAAYNGTYGWKLTDDTIQANQPAVERDSRYRTLNYFKDQQGTNHYLWEVDIASGHTYTVTIVAGDPTIESDTQYRILAEGVEVINVLATPDNPWIEATAEITVTDGFLTISGNQSLSNNAICFVKIELPDEPNPPIKIGYFNFQPDPAADPDNLPAVPDGYLGDFGEAYGTQGTYGWRLDDGDTYPSEDNLQSVARDFKEAPDTASRTFNVFKRSTETYKWEYNVGSNGDYYVFIKAGDPYTNTNRDYHIYAEGQTIIDDTATRTDPYLTGGAMVPVNDGVLTLTANQNFNNTICYVKFAAVGSMEAPAYDLPLYYYNPQSPADLTRGNLREDSHFTYDWNALDRPAQITDKTYDEAAGTHPTPQSVYYLYDVMGRRVAIRYQWAAGQKPTLNDDSPWQDAMLIYDGLQLVEERYITGGFAGEIKRRYYYEEGINKLALLEKYDGTGSVSASYIPLTDDRGTVMGVVDAANGQVIEKLYYNSTGLCKSFDGSGQPNLNGTFNVGRSLYIPFGWCGMYRDEFTGKYHTHFREYDPIHGRWLSEDPAGYRDGLSLYAAYMGVNGVDMYGLGGFWDLGPLKMKLKMTKMGADYVKNEVITPILVEPILVAKETVQIAHTLITDEDHLPDRYESRLNARGGSLDRYQAIGDACSKDGMSDSAASGYATVWGVYEFFGLRSIYEGVEGEEFTFEGANLSGMRDIDGTTRVIKVATGSAQFAGVATGGLAAGRFTTKLFTKPRMPSGGAGILRPSNNLLDNRVINPRLSHRLEKWKAYKAGGGNMDMQSWVKSTQRHYGGVSGGYESGLARRSSRIDGVHGNSLLSKKTAYLYRLEDAEGNLLKWGITQNMKTRYPSSFMFKKNMIPVKSGSRFDMHFTERFFVETQPGPLNLEPWAGSKIK